jgi:feruloyl-CoA synthase
LIIDDVVHKTIARALAALADSAGSAARVERLLVMARPADLDAGEITDKGYVNQRTVLARRAELVEMLYAEPAPEGVVVAGRNA